MHYVSDILHQFALAVPQVRPAFTSLSADMDKDSLACDPSASWALLSQEDMLIDDDACMPLDITINIITIRQLVSIRLTVCSKIERRITI